VTPAEAKSAVLELCRAKDFTRVKIAPSGPTAHSAFIHEWIKRGYHGSMDWFERAPQFREDIRIRYPWVRSFIMLAIDYATELTEDESILRHIARYARDIDYHDAFKPRLLELENEIKRLEPGTQALWYQDTGPFLERELAARAGLGWQGKNTLLIDPESGSYKFLALVATSLEITPDSPITDHCGTCTACLDACPTKAFPEPYVLDARKCISYLTIEHEGPIAPEHREAMGELVFGCDICQEVCPWNSKAPKIDEDAPEELATLTLDKVLSLKPQFLLKRIVGTPLERAGVNRLRRNAAIAAGNMGEESLVPALEKAARNEFEWVREAVYWALKKIGGDEAKQALARAQRHESDEGLREMVIQYLQDWHNS
jgi:epoxyqueuosine reductase